MGQWGYAKDSSVVSVACVRGVASTTIVYREHWRCVCAIDNIAIYGGTEMLKMRGCPEAPWVRDGMHNSGSGLGWAYPVLPPGGEEEGCSSMLEGASVKPITTKENRTQGLCQGTTNEQRPTMGPRLGTSPQAQHAAPSPVGL